MKLSWTRHHTYFFWGSVTFLTALSLSFFSIFSLLMNEVNTQNAALAQNKSIEPDIRGPFAEDTPTESKASISIQAGNPFLHTGSAIGLYRGVNGVISLVIEGDESQLKDCASASDGAAIITSSETGEEIRAITISRCNLRNGDLSIPGVNLNEGKYLLRVIRDDAVSNALQFIVSPAIRPQKLKVSLAASYSSQPTSNFGVAITSVGRAMAGRPFPIGIDIGPQISGGFSASITWVEQGTPRSKSITSADVQAGFVTIVAPQQPGEYTLTLSATRLVDGANAETTTGINVLPASARSEKVLVPTVYVLAVNNEASPASRLVFEKLVTTMSFFTNIPDISPESIVSLQRDYKRLLDMRAMVNALDNYRARVGQYPTISSGSFVPNFTISRWNSWQEVLGKAIGFAPLDPKNEFGNQDNFSLLPRVLTIPDPQPSQTTLLPDGLSSGMGVVYQSTEPVNRASVSKILSVNAEGNAASWELKIGNGVITRLFDSPVPGDVLTRQKWYKDICLNTGLKCETTSGSNAASRPNVLRVASRGVEGGNVVFAQSFYQFSNPQTVGAHQYFEYEGRCVNGPCTAYLHLLSPGFILGTGFYPFSPPPISDTTWRTVRIRLEPNFVFDRILVREESDVSSAVRSEFRNIRIVEENQRDGTFIPKRTLWNGEEIISSNRTCRIQGGAVFRSREEGSVIVHFDPTQPSRSTNPPLRVVIDNQCYSDPSQSDSFAAGLNEYLVERGARNLSATEIAQAIIQNKLENGTTLVFAQDMIPQELADPNLPLTDSLLRKFIDQGGKVIVLGQQPLSTISTGTSLLSVRKENFGDYEMLANVAPDPCPGHDPQTCWSPSKKTFACPFNSRIYVYRALNPQRFQLATNLENPNMRWGIDVFDQKWPGTNISRVEFFITECSDPASVAAARSGIYDNALTFCGDGLVQAPQEQCEIGDTRNMCSARRYYLDGDGTYRRIPARFRNSTQWRGAKMQSCSPNCTFDAIEYENGIPIDTSLNAQCGGFCGDGIIQYPLEECDRSFDPTLSGDRCSNGTLPSCGSACRSSCSSGQVISCATSGKLPRNLTITGLSSGQVDLSIRMPRTNVSSDPPEIKNYSRVIQNDVVTVGPLPVISSQAIDGNVVCGYSLKIGNKYYTVPPTPEDESTPWVVNINSVSPLSSQ